MGLLHGYKLLEDYPQSEKERERENLWISNWSKTVSFVMTGILMNVHRCEAASDIYAEHWRDQTATRIYFAAYESLDYPGDLCSLLSLKPILSVAPSEEFVQH